MSSRGAMMGRPRAGFSALNALKNKKFRWLWFGNLFSLNAMQMQVVVGGWLVLTLTNSPLALGLVSAGWGLPILVFSLFGGVIADRVRKRNLLLITQSCVFIQTFVIAYLIHSDEIAIWHLVISSVLGGVIGSFSMPARQSFLVEIVDRDGLLNAIALSSTAFNLCRVLSPAIAGVLIKFIGIPGVYWIIVVSYAFAAMCLLKIPAGESMEAKPDVPVMSDLKEGFRYVADNKLIRTLIIISFITIFVAMPYGMLMPVFARNVFKVGETGLGIFMSATGLGALCGSTIIASLGNYRRRGELMLTAGIGFASFLFLFAVSNNFMSAIVFLLFVGAGGSIFMTIVNSLIMTNTEPELVGRVMSIYTWTFGLMPLAMLPAGAMAEYFGAPLTVGLGGSIMIVYMLALAIGMPFLRRLR